MPWTSHGYWTGLREPTEPAPPRLDCGGPHRCIQCAAEAHQLEAEIAMPTAEQRHPTTVHLLRQFRLEHLPEHLQRASRPFHDLAQAVATEFADSPELSFGLRQLLLAKDAIVRCAVDKNTG